MPELYWYYMCPIRVFVSCGAKVKRFLIYYTQTFPFHVCCQILDGTRLTIAICRASLEFGMT